MHQLFYIVSVTTAIKFSHQTCMTMAQVKQKSNRLHELPEDTKPDSVNKSIIVFVSALCLIPPSSLVHKLSNIWRQDMSAREQSKRHAGSEAAEAGGPRRRGRLLWPRGRQLVEIVGAVHLFVRAPGP